MEFSLRLLRRFSLAALLFIPGMMHGDDTIYTKVDENPVPIKTPPPVYPDAMRSQGVSGIVSVIIVIDEQGAVSEVNVGKASHQEFEQPAVNAVKKWKFKPAKKEGNPVKVKVTIPVRFSID